jgi:hypothetical protein
LTTQLDIQHFKLAKNPVCDVDWIRPDMDNSESEDGTSGTKTKLGESPTVMNLNKSGTT